MLLADLNLTAPAKGGFELVTSKVKGEVSSKHLVSKDRLWLSRVEDI